MRSEVQIFVADGPLPDWESTEEEIDRRCDQLMAITKPVTTEEAHALASRLSSPGACDRAGRDRLRGRAAVSSPSYVSG
ncbi:hypothetical protein [Streptomyces sp. NPDC002265]|uniref:hypothetical protein n=1 Tax=Streptomyces sp. NPDC002265 TaxID=3154415 RepID=UPI003318702E